MDPYDRTSKGKRRAEKALKQVLLDEEHAIRVDEKVQSIVSRKINSLETLHGICPALCSIS